MRTMGHARRNPAPVLVAVIGRHGQLIQPWLRSMRVPVGYSRRISNFCVATGSENNVQHTANTAKPDKITSNCDAKANLPNEVLLTQSKYVVELLDGHISIYSSLRKA